LEMDVILKDVALLLVARLHLESIKVQRTSGAYRHAAKCQSPPFLAEGTRGGAVPDSPLGNAISINNYQMK
jgi:hypothetical protein